MTAKPPLPVEEQSTWLGQWSGLLGTFQERLLFLVMCVLVIGTAGVLFLLYQQSNEFDAAMLQRDLIVVIAVYGLGLLGLALVIRRLRQTRATLQRERPRHHHGERGNRPAQCGGLGRRACTSFATQLYSSPTGFEPTDNRTSLGFRGGLETTSRTATFHEFH